MNNRLKAILILLGIIAVIVYLTFAFVSFSGRHDEKTCNEVVVSIKDSTELRFISDKKIAAMLQKAQINTIGQKMKDINTATIEAVLEKHPVIKDVECYKTSSGKLKIDVWQKKPMFRIMLDDGSNYYIDYKREKMPLSDDFVAYVPIVTGIANKEFITNELFDFIVFLRNDKFWEAQITQINILSNKEIELVPRVGNHIVFLGTLDNYDTKLSNLMKLYKEALNTSGWNQYAKINLQYKDQIICTKKH